MRSLHVLHSIEHRQTTIESDAPDGLVYPHRFAQQSHLFCHRMTRMSTLQRYTLCAIRAPSHRISLADKSPARMHASRSHPNAYSHAFWMFRKGTGKTRNGRRRQTATLSLYALFAFDRVPGELEEGERTRRPSNSFHVREDEGVKDSIHFPCLNPGRRRVLELYSAM